jgi:hypothetical protein
VRQSFAGGFPFRVQDGWTQGDVDVCCEHSRIYGFMG